MPVSTGRGASPDAAAAHRGRVPAAALQAERTRRSWIVAALIGAGSALAIVAVSAYLIFRLTVRSGVSSAPDDTGVGGFVAAMAVPIVGLYLLVGMLAGIASAWSAREPRPWRVAAGVAGLWIVLGCASVVLVPDTLTQFGFLHRVPYAAALGAGALAAAAAAAVARARPLRYAAAAALLAAPMFIPEPAVRVPPAPPAARGSVLLLGVDNAGRGGMTRIVADVVRRGNGGGARYLSEVVSQVPVTRGAWRSIVMQRDPLELSALDTLAPEARGRAAPGRPETLTAVAGRLGYGSVYISDDATTLNPVPGGAWQRVRKTAGGWHAVLREGAGRGLPLYDLYLGRFQAPGLVRAPGSAGARRVYRLAAEELASRSAAPRLVAAHGVTLHPELHASLAEAGGFRTLLGLTPGDFTDAPGARRSQLYVYRHRLGRVLGETGDFLAQLQREGYRRRDLVIVFTDHDHNLEGAGDDDGIHGTNLSSALVGVLVLFPGAAPGDSARVVRGTFPLYRIAQLASEFMARESGAALPATALLPRVAAAAELGHRCLPVGTLGRTRVEDDPRDPRRSIPYRQATGAMRFWRGGGMSFGAADWRALMATADAGWSDGVRLVSYSPLIRGGWMREQYRGRTLTARDTVPLPVKPPAGVCADDPP